MWIVFSGFVLLVVAVAVAAAMPYVQKDSPVVVVSPAAPTSADTQMQTGLTPTGMSYKMMCTVQQEMSAEVVPDFTRVPELLNGSAPSDSYLYKLNLELAYDEYLAYDSPATRIALARAMIKIAEYCNS